MVRIALVAVVTVVGVEGLRSSMAQLVAVGDPQAAHQLAPRDGRITAMLAAALSGQNATAQDRRRADDFARQALQQDPTAILAVSTLGLNAQLAGNNAAAGRYFAYAQSLSRRDITTHLWMIEAAVNRGDVSGALRQYDITLRVFPEFGELLYPVLAAALTEPEIRAGLVRTFVARPPWSAAFIDYAAEKGGDPRTSAILFAGLGRAGVSVAPVAQARMVNRLVGAGHIDAAWAYYGSIRPGAERGRSRDTQFSHDIAARSELDWIPLSDGAITTSIQDGFFEFAAPSGIGGPVLRQMQLLRPGRYRLAGHSVGIGQAVDARPYWLLTCSDGRELGRVEVPDSSIADGLFSGELTVPADCPLQNLTLIAPPATAVAGSSGQIDRAALTPVAR